jgi:type II secretory pathway component HofQ
VARLALLLLIAGCGGSEPSASPRFDDLDEPRTSPPAAEPALPSSSPPPPTAATPADRPRAGGKLLDIDVVDADLHNVFRLLADAGGVNLVVSDEVKGTVTLRLRRVPWHQVFDTVIKLKKLHVERNGDVYLITVGPP